MSGNVLQIDDSNFESEVSGAPVPVLIDFAAEWCAPCKKLAPVVADLARQYAGRLKVGHVDVEASPATAARFGVMSLPTLIFFRGGQPASQVNGALSRRDLEQAILRVIG